jgi:hypothetical protein
MRSAVRGKNEIARHHPILIAMAPAKIAVINSASPKNANTGNGK